MSKQKKFNDFMSIYNTQPEHIHQILDNYTEQELSYFIKIFKKHYYDNSTPLITDEYYDIIETFIKKKYPNNSICDKIGSTPVKKIKVKLPYFMGSLNKIKHNTPELIVKWCQKYSGEYVLQPKLDGVSGMFIYKNGISKLYTRGDGTYGQDVSHLLKYIHFPQSILEPSIPELCLRGEFIISKQIFETKYIKLFSNSRNMISGLINQKDQKEQKNNTLLDGFDGVPETQDIPFNDINFIVYEIIQPQLKPTEQMDYLLNLYNHQENHTPQQGFKLSLYYIKETLDIEELTNILCQLKKDYEYEIDGIVIKENKVYEREINENPKHQFAFKMNFENNYAIVKVTDVLWNVSKDGYLKPQVVIEETYLDGVNINNTTGFNAGYIKSNKIGPGSVIKIMRSGSVIPHIIEVIEPSPTGEKMPCVDYKWNDTNVDIILNDTSLNNHIILNGEEENQVSNIEAKKDMIIKNIAFFFKNMEIDNIGIGIITKLVENGYDSIEKIIKMTISDFLKIDGFKVTLSKKIYTNIQEKITKNIDIHKLMCASNLFGRGLSTKRIESILKTYPDILKIYSSENENELINMICSIKGFQEKTAILFVKGIPKFNDFIEKCNIEINNDHYIQQQDETEQQQPDTGNTINNDSIELLNKLGICKKEDGTQRDLTFLITGFRNNDINKKLASIGFKEITTISKKIHIDLLIIKDETYENVKTKTIINQCPNVVIKTQEMINELLHL